MAPVLGVGNQSNDTVSTVTRHASRKSSPPRRGARELIRVRSMERRPIPRGPTIHQHGRTLRRDIVGSRDETPGLTPASSDVAEDLGDLHRADLSDYLVRVDFLGDLHRKMGVWSGYINLGLLDRRRHRRHGGAGGGRDVLERPFRSIARSISTYSSLMFTSSLRTVSRRKTSALTVTDDW